MKILKGIITIFLILGLLGVPSSVFAQESSYIGSDSTLQYSDSTFLDINLPLLKGGGGGGRGGGSSKSSSSKKVKTDGDDDNSTDDGSGGTSWFSIIIIIIVILAVIGFLVWLFIFRR